MPRILVPLFAALAAAACGGGAANPAAPAAKPSLVYFTMKG